MFEKTQRPVAVSLTNGQNPGAIKGVNFKGGESETETEREGDGVLGLFGVSLKGGMDRGYPFPASTYSSSAAAGLGLSTGSGKDANGKDLAPRIEIAKAKSSNVPSVPGLIAPRTLQESSQKVHLESAVLASPSPSSSSASGDGEKGDEILKGTILVENVSFGKSVYIRFTLDDWQTTSEVGANWVCSLPALAPAGSSSAPTSLGFSHGRDRSKSEPALSSMGSSGSEPVKGRQFDRFSFSINLSSIRSLHTRRLFAVVRFQPHGWNEEFWDNAGGENYRFVFERAAPSSVLSSASPKKVGQGLGLAGAGERERRSSMPVSPGEKATGVGKRFIKLSEVGDRDESADEEEVARKEKERLLALARERPVPRLPGVGFGPSATHHLHGLGGMEKSASAPSLAHHHAHMHHAQNMHSLPFPASIAKSNVHSHHYPSQSLSSSASSSPPSNDDVANRARSGSASNYPAIHLRLSNYISPTSPTVKSPIGSRTSSASSSDFMRPPTIDTVAQNGKGAAPLSPPASPVADKRASPAPSPPRSQSPPRAAVVSDNASFSSLILAPSQTQSQSQSLQSQPRSITPPESANTSPEPSQVPLPLSQSSSSSTSNTSSSPSNSSDSDRDNLHLAFSSPHQPKAHHVGNGPSAGGNYYKRSMTHSPEFHASQQAARMANRAPVPRGLDFAARLSMSGLGVNGNSAGGGEESMGDAHAGQLHGSSSHGHHHHHHHHSHPVQHQAKFTLGGARSAHGGGSNSSSPVSSSTSTPVGVMSPASGTQSPVHTSAAAVPSANGLASQLGVVGSSNSALNRLVNTSAAQSHSGTDSPNPFNNAPPEFLQKFCFFGSPEPSPTHTHSQPFGSVVGSPVMLGAEVVPGALLAGGRQNEYLGAYSPMFGQQRVQ